MTVLLTGGAGCGKSEYGEALCVSLSGPLYYVASMRPEGRDADEKIARHRIRRAGKGFETIERYENLSGLVLPRRGTVLLECVATLAANEMFPRGDGITDPFAPVIEGVAALEEQCNHLVVITNDVGSGGLDYDDWTLRYIRALGRINAALAQWADRVCELVCGIALARKGALPL